MMLAGLGLLIFGFAFKVSLAPFHLWTPDVYQGSPTSITAFMAVVVKVAAFASFMRIMLLAFGPVIESWSAVIWGLAVISMTVGNLVALRQDSIKRMLAYSSVAHAGYALMGFLSFEGGAEATTFYLVVYSFMTLASFGVVLLVSTGTSRQYESDSIESFRGLGWSNPLLGLIMVLAMLSLAGIPPLAGFFGKLYLFSAVVAQGYIWLAIIAALNSAVALFYYLRVIVVMYFSEESRERVTIDFAPGLSIIVSTIFLLYVGLFSGGVLEVAQKAIKSLGIL
jgi:NADH-quinone oxidoreductase subunit N